MGTAISQICSILKKNSLRITPGRLNILDIFFEQADKLFTAREVFDLVRRRDPRINFSTVYRNLGVLVLHGIIEKYELDGIAAYQLYSAVLPGHRMICKVCRHTRPLPYCPVAELENYLLKVNSGFFPQEHHIEIYGICAVCQKKELIFP